MLEKLTEKGRRLWGRISPYPRLSSAFLSLILLIIVFPDVIFRGASFLVTDNFIAGSQGFRPRWFYPPPLQHGWWSGHIDDGGSLWQSEPMMEFIRYCIRTLNSPYWNPFSAAGALGPETLIDLKFSVLTLAYALLGGGSLVYNLLILAAYGAAAYFLLQIVREKLGLSTVAGFAACIFYMLNGYASANVVTNVYLSYLLIPLCLYASFVYVEAPSPRHWALLALSFAAFLSFTFMPTTIMGGLTICCLTAGYALSLRERDKGSARRLAGVAVGYGLAWMAAACVLAVFFLPFFESLSQSGILSNYQQRVYYPAYLSGALSLFSPSHFFESYNAAEVRVFSYFNGFGVTGHTIYHFGIIGLSLAACALTLRGNRWRWLIIACLVTMGVALGRLFALPGIMQVVDHLPVLRNLGCQYLWTPVVMSLVLLVALGTENVELNRPARLPAAFVLAGGLAAAVYLAVIYGVRPPKVFFKIQCLFMLALWAAAVIAALWMRWQFWLNRPGWKTSVLLVVLLFVELTADAKALREKTMNVFTSPPPWATYLHKNIGQQRTMTLSVYGLGGEMGSAYQIPEVTSLNEGTLPSYGEYFTKMVQMDPSQRWSYISLGKVEDKPDKVTFNWPLVDLLGVKYVLLPVTYNATTAALESQGLRKVEDFPPVRIMENPHVLPRAFTIDVAANPSAPDVDLPRGFRDHIAPAEIVISRNAEVEIRGTAVTPRLLVLTDNWHLNWKATVNGASAPIVKVEGTFRGVWVPAGAFDVRMNYRPKTLTTALWVSGLSLAGLILLVVRKPRRRSPHSGVA